MLVYAKYMQENGWQ